MPLTKPLREGIETAVRDKLKDPESARFKHFDYGSKGTYCGLVNSKNAFGGYVGDVPYWVMILPDDKVEVMGLGDGDLERQFVTSMCTSSGYSL